jgi:lipopolysaccharide/colanic/teichoic acid biosynthesis glycosyltransferase
MLNQRTQVSWWQSSGLPQVDYGPCVARSAHLSLYPVAKRCLDVLVSALILFLVLPLLAAIAIAIKLDSEGPILHVQKRTGRYGRTFSFYKFRSMTNSRDHTEEHRKFAKAYINGHCVAATKDGNGRVIYKPAANGQRITRVGRWLRRTSLDELPQLINVLKGDMSLVGPRPTMDFETLLYTERHQLRLAVLPGLTGWAQIHGRSGLSFDDIVTYDIDYIRRRSFWFDVKVIASTIPVVLSAEHAG